LQRLIFDLNVGFTPQLDDRCLAEQGNFDVAWRMNQPAYGLSPVANAGGDSSFFGVTQQVSAM